MRKCYYYKHDQIGRTEIKEARRFEITPNGDLVFYDANENINCVVAKGEWRKAERCDS